jgi:hypothetical protein
MISSQRSVNIKVRQPFKFPPTPLWKGGKVDFHPFSPGGKQPWKKGSFSLTILAFFRYPFFALWVAFWPDGPIQIEIWK